MRQTLRKGLLLLCCIYYAVIASKYNRQVPTRQCDKIGDNMNGLTLKEAGEAVGRSKQALQLAIKNGKLSASKDNKGAYRIEPCELFRVYAPITEQFKQEKPTSIEHNYISEKLLIAQLQAKLDAQEVILDERKRQIDDLKTQNRSLDQERKDAQQRLNNLLTGQSKRKGLLGRLFG